MKISILDDLATLIEIERRYGKYFYNGLQIFTVILYPSMQKVNLGETLKEKMDYIINIGKISDGDEIFVRQYIPRKKL